MPEKATPLFLVYSGDVLDEPVYRAVAGCPPTIGDFHSYEVLGMPHAPRQHFRATGISVFVDRDRLAEHVRKYSLPPSIATLDLRFRDVVWTRSGRSAHLTVWAPASVLLERVVQCDNHG